MIWIATSIYNWMMDVLEKKLGYRLEFTNIPDTWIDGWMRFDMGRTWHKQGVRANGMNYFTMGSLVDGVSSRFLPKEKQYQSWLGAYLVKFDKKKDFSLQDHYDLAIADQKNWLKEFGDPKPFIKIPAEKTRTVQDIKISGYNARLYEFPEAPSHVDLGPNSRNFRNKILMRLLASMFNKSNPKLHLKGEHFLPTQLPDNYQTVNLKGCMMVVELEENLKMVAYGNAAQTDNKDYYSSLKKDILKAFKSIKIEKL